LKEVDKMSFLPKIDERGKNWDAPRHLALRKAIALTSLNFLVFTAVHILYALVAWWMLRRGNIPGWQRLLGMGSFGVLTFISGMLAAFSFVIAFPMQIVSS